LLFDTINARNGVLMVNRNRPVPVQRVYAPFPAFEIGEVSLNRGQAIFEVLVYDISGNSRSNIVRMTVE
jgi:hypothetical protein